MEKRPIVYVALDYNDRQSNLGLARELAEKVDSDNFGFKINLDSLLDFWFGASNPSRFVSEIISYRRPVFLDLKMWNGGRTMANIARGAKVLGVDIINMYPHAGGKFMGGVVKALEGTKTKLFGLTVLTHYTDEDTQRLYGKNLSDAVRMLAEMNQEYGAHGIIVPGTQLEVVRDIPLLKLCPGIRPEWYQDRKDNDQEQVVTHKEAIERGADYIVVGSPIRKSEDKPKALERILKEIGVMQSET